MGDHIIEYIIWCKPERRQGKINRAKHSRQNVWNFQGITKDILKKENNNVSNRIGNT